MMIPILSLLILLQIKHFYVDYVNQTIEEIKHKGIYFNWLGVKHSLKHGFGTFVVFLIFLEWKGALVLGILDFLIHYHIDWFKAKYGNSDPNTKTFWTHLGLDQLAHQLTYIGMLCLMII